MPVIVDTNCFANVFSKSSSKHADFKPVLDWILSGKGALVYGGSTYINELKKAKKYLTIFRLLKEAGKVIEGDTKKIDTIQAKITKAKDSADFDDEHLLAIAANTKCRIICSEDARSIKYVTDKKFLPKNSVRPVYYTSRKNLDLLCDNYVDPILKPLCKLDKTTARRLYSST